MTVKKQSFLVLFILFSFYYVQSQVDVFKDEVTYNGDRVFYKGKPLTGTLYDPQDGVKNECYCILKAKYKNGYLNGVKKQWYQSGKLKENAIYRNGKISSRKKYFSNGKLRKKETFDNGNIISSILYNKDGTPKNSSPTTSEVINKPKKTNSQTSNIAQNPNNTASVIPSQETSVPNSDSFNGLLRIYYPNGKVKRVTFHKNGLLVKDSIFYDNESLKMTKKFSDGELIHHEKYSDKNILLKEMNFLNNKKEGIQRANFENGKPKIIEEYKNGDLVHYEAYFENGNLKHEQNYKFNKKNGVQKLFDSSGELLSLQVFDMGKLVKNEIYGDNFKKIITHINGLIETKKYNKNDQLIRLQYIDEKTKQKDSLWIEFDSVTENKLTEKAYVNAKKTREGQYTDNKKDGVWKYFAQNSLSETKVVYKMGEKVSSKKLIYAKQIKNNVKKGDEIYNYFIPKVKKKDNYVLLRIDSISNNYATQIKNAIQEVFKQHFRTVEEINSIGEIELTSILNVSDIKYRFKPQKAGSNKFIAYIATTLKLNNLRQDSISQIKFSVTPANKKHPNVNSLYRKDKQAAFVETLANLKQKISLFLEENFPNIGIIYRPTQQNSKEVSEVSLYFENPKNINEKDIFVVLKNELETSIQLKVSKINDHIIICKVLSDKDRLKQLMMLQKNPIVKKIISK